MPLTDGEPSYTLTGDSSGGRSARRCACVYLYVPEGAAEAVGPRRLRLGARPGKNLGTCVFTTYGSCTSNFHSRSTCPFFFSKKKDSKRIFFLFSVKCLWCCKARDSKRQMRVETLFIHWSMVVHIYIHTWKDISEGMPSERAVDH